MFLRCSYFFVKSEADVLINSVLMKRNACSLQSANCSFVHFFFEDLLLDRVKDRLRKKPKQ